MGRMKSCSIKELYLISFFTLITNITYYLVYFPVLLLCSDSFNDSFMITFQTLFLVSVLNNSSIEHLLSWLYFHLLEKWKFILNSSSHLSVWVINQMTCHKNLWGGMEWLWFLRLRLLCQFKWVRPLALYSYLFHQ